MSLKKGSEVELTIEDTAYKGKGIAKVDGLAVFVPNTAPGDKVLARIVKKKKRYREAKVLELLEPSEHRVEPKCQHATNCGGCTWQHVPYDFQLEMKQQHVANHMKRIGHFEDLTVHKTLGCEKPFYYRNKMEYSFGHKRWLSREEINADEFISDKGLWGGLHAPGRFDKILNLNECHLQDPISFEILDFVRNYALARNLKAYNTFENTGYFRNLVIRNAHHTDDLMVNVVTNRDEEKVMNNLTEALLNQFPQITTIVNNVNDTKSPTAVGRYEKVYHGSGHITDHIGPYEFKITANAFFQTNTLQAEHLYNVAKQYVDPHPDDVLYDLYCGVGTLSLFMSQSVKKVVGIELDEVAVENAKESADNNQVNNCSFIEGDMKEAFSPDVVEEHGRPDCLITDPPRSGMHHEVLQHLQELKIPKIVYVSCNSSTQARDLSMLKDVYEVQEIQPVDMFPQTYHIESVAKLRLKS
jgi:23S rRNA (uracil1939-C5)-methyltransferase